MTEPKKRGRPQSPEPKYAVSTWLSESEHLRVMQVAKHEGASVSAVIRSAVREKIERELRV